MVPFYRKQEFHATVEEVLERKLPEAGLELELPTLHPHNPSPSETFRRSSSASDEGYVHWSSSSIDHIVGIVLLSSYY